MAQIFITNLDKVGYRYLQQLKALVTKTSFTKSLKENPYYPSLLSLSSTFNRYNITNSAFKIEKDKLDQVPLPFIAFISSDIGDDDFAYVTAIFNESVEVTYDGEKTRLVSKEFFLNHFLQVVFVAQTNCKSGEQNYELNKKSELKKRNKNHFLLSCATIVFLFIIFHFNYTSPDFFSSLSLSIILLSGLFITSFLIIYEIDKTNSFIKNICAGSNTKRNCDAVLHSNVSTIFGVTWSEIGFGYFASIALFTFFTSVPISYQLPYIALSFTLGSLYIPFSIYYQFKVVRQWCPLCMATQAVLAVGLIWSIFSFWLNNSANLSFSIYYSTIILSCILLPVISWLFIKPVLLKAKDSVYFHEAYKRLLYNPEIFNGLLQQQPKAATGWEDLGITIGNTNAETTIIKVCNPFCGPCTLAHPILENIVEENNNVNLKIIFTASGDEKDIKLKTVKHLMAIASQNNASTTKQAIDDWYGAKVKDYDAFAKKYILNEDLRMQDEKINAMKKWCDVSSITYTPTIFINGYRLPETYNIEDLKNIL